MPTPRGQQVTGSFLRAVDALAPELVEGLYLRGSLGFGELHPDQSDADHPHAPKRRVGVGLRHTIA